MNNQTLPRISLTLIGIMWVFPFLYWYHAYPLTTFYQEWISGVVGLSAVLFLIASKTVEVPRIALLPFGLALIVIVQFVIGRIDHLDQVLLFSMYMTFAILMMILGWQLRAVLGLAIVATWLAIALLIGAELNALAGVLQHFKWGTILDQFVVSKIDIAVYGNIGQPNQFADYIALGLISLWLIYERFSMRIWQVAILASPLLLVMALSRSRTAILYLAIIAGIIYLQKKPKLNLTKWIYVCIAALLVAITAYIIINPSFISGSIRIHLWKNAALIFEQFPILGAGFGQFAYQNMLLSSLHDTVIIGLYNNAHNILFQISAELGLIGVIYFCWMIGAFIWRIIKVDITIYHLWGYGCLAIIGIHSLLEYPLWYLYFIGIAAVLLGIFDSQSIKTEQSRIFRSYIAVVLLIGFASMYQLYQGYKHLELADDYRNAAIKDKRYLPTMLKELQIVHGNSYLQSYAELYIAGTMGIGKEYLQDRIALNDRAMKFAPLATFTYHQAWLLALAGKNEEAKNQIERAIWSYPSDYKIAMNELKELADKDPEHFSYMLEFAQPEYERYLLASK